jgi:predicted nucleotidyltransferase
VRPPRWISSTAQIICAVRSIETLDAIAVTEIAQKPDVERAIALFLDTLRRGYAVDELRLYGARARGGFRPDSDVDPAVVLHGRRGDFWETGRAMSDITIRRDR